MSDLDAARQQRDLLDSEIGNMAGIEPRPQHTHLQTAHRHLEGAQRIPSDVEEGLALEPYLVLFRIDEAVRIGQTRIRIEPYDRSVGQREPSLAVLGRHEHRGAVRRQMPHDEKFDGHRQHDDRGGDRSGATRERDRAESQRRTHLPVQTGELAAIRLFIRRKHGSGIEPLPLLPQGFGLLVRTLLSQAPRPELPLHLLGHRVVQIGAYDFSYDVHFFDTFIYKTGKRAASPVRSGPFFAKKSNDRHRCSGSAA